MDGLMMHEAGSSRVTMQDLWNLPLPAQRGSRHWPIPHRVLVERLVEQINGVGLKIVKQELGIARHGTRVFGTMQVTGDGTMKGRQALDVQSTLGFRSSTDSSLGIRMVVGVTVFVCDNLCMSGDEFVLRRKSTFWNGSYESDQQLDGLLRNGVQRFLKRTPNFQRNILYMKDYGLSGENAKALLFEVFNKGVLPKVLLQETGRLYLSPSKDHEDCQPRSLWGLNNACTRAIKSLKQPAARFEAATRVGAHFANLVGQSAA
jgi:hypothetical protein